MGLSKNIPKLGTVHRTIVPVSENKVPQNPMVCEFYDHYSHLKGLFWGTPDSQTPIEWNEDDKP
jgi:hypothetical protein